MIKATVCCVADCERLHYAQGYCGPHYQRIEKWGDPQAHIPVRIRRPTRGTCSVDGCGRSHYVRGWCEAHHSRWRKTGDVQPDVPLGTRQSREGSCRIEGCERPINARRMCVAHLRREDKWGDPLASAPIKSPSDGKCSVDGCENEHAGLGWCDFHYQPYRLYRLTPDAYAALIAKQGGGCAICGAEPPVGSRLHIDHDHACCPGKKRSCGKCVRGLLCGRCNPMLGLANDDPERLARAIAYLQETARDAP